MTPNPSTKARRRLGAALCAAVLAALGLTVAGCGSKPGTPAVASLGKASTTTTTTPAPGASVTPADKHKLGMAFSACMRTHGVPNFPDPTSQGGLVINSQSGIDPSSASFQKAQQACQKLLPNGGQPTAAQQAKARSQLLAYSACMRSHGVPDFPDPVFQGARASLKVTAGNGLNPNSPQFQKAQQACQSVLPGAPVGSRSAGKAAVTSSGGGAKSTGGAVIGIG